MKQETKMYCLAINSPTSICWLFQVWIYLPKGAKVVVFFAWLVFVIWSYFSQNVYYPQKNIQLSEEAGFSH